MGMATLTVGILIFDGVLTSDVTGPAEVFGAAAADDSTIEVLLIHTGGGPVVTTAEGLVLAASVSMGEAPPLDVLVVPGSMDPSVQIADEGLLAFIRDQEGWLSSNCAGAFILAASGELDGYRATTYAGGEGDLQTARPQVEVVERQQIVIDRDRMTSHGGLTSYPAALMLLASVRSEEAAKTVFDHLAMADGGTWKSMQKAARGGRRVK